VGLPILFAIPFVVALSRAERRHDAIRRGTPPAA
jgi:hypothetical protein